jgi:hypothetical protein
VLGGIAALSDKARGLATYLFFGVVGSSVGGALLAPVFGIQLNTADPVVTTTDVGRNRRGLPTHVGSAGAEYAGALQRLPDYDHRHDRGV